MDRLAEFRLGPLRSLAVEVFNVIAAFMAVIGLLLVVSALTRHPSLGERLAPYQPPSVADEAQEWLRGQR